jgi:hypothetical protein
MNSVCQEVAEWKRAPRFQELFKQSKRPGGLHDSGRGIGRGRAGAGAVLN